MVALHECSVVNRSPLLLSVVDRADELQRNIDRLASELHATRQEVQQLSEELLALHEHADIETAQVSTSGGCMLTCTSLQD